MSEAGVSQPQLVTPRLRLRRLRPADAALITLYSSDARVAWTTAVIPHPYPPGRAEAFIERVLAPGAQELGWALDAGADDENGLIGTIGLNPVDEGEAEIGYWVAAPFWNAGYASEAVAALVAWASGAGWRTLLAGAFQDNPASVRVLLRAGFACIGEGETHSVARGGMVPTFRYRCELAAA